MQIVRLDGIQAGNKTAGRNINNLINTDDTTLIAESEVELKSLLMRVNEEGEKAGLKLNMKKKHKKPKILASSPIMANMGNSESSDKFYFLGLQNHCRH